MFPFRHTCTLSAPLIGIRPSSIRQSATFACYKDNLAFVLVFALTANVFLPLPTCTI